MATLKFSGLMWNSGGRNILKPVMSEVGCPWRRFWTFFTTSCVAILQNKGDFRH
jgi:hypothetical protein